MEIKIIMEEENKQTETKETQEIPSSVKLAQEAADRLKAENERMEKNLARQEELRMNKILGGESQAGQQTEEPKEETPSEYRKRIEKEVSEGKFNPPRQ